MSTRRITIASADALEGVLRENGNRGGAVICHPHPLYGGSMENNVVEALEEGFLQSGFATLRFNFRGVGESQGAYDDGDGEVDDAVAACAYMRDMLGPGTRLVLAGYSFGAWVASRAAGQIPGLEDLVLVAYPFSRYECAELRTFRGRLCFVGGSFDDISPYDQLMECYREVHAEKYLKVLPASHFFPGVEPDIRDFVHQIFGAASSG